jgi:hypothetical protein
MSSPNIYRYRLVYQRCPECSIRFRLGKVLMSPKPLLDGHSLLDLYHGDASRSEVVAILGEHIQCPNSHKITNPELEQFFLEEAH